MNADPLVMEFFPQALSAAQSEALVDAFDAELAKEGFCPWAVEERASGAFIGFVGLHAIPGYLPFSPGTEVGWRLARAFWSRGYATEAATAALQFGFEILGIDSVVSFTAAVNLRSRRVMERLGMSYDEAGDFDHPKIAVGHRLRPHVLYGLSSRDWQASRR